MGLWLLAVAALSHSYKATDVGFRQTVVEPFLTSMDGTVMVATTTATARHYLVENVA